jgi:Ala-tRNA(Pro) deacylase
MPILGKLREFLETNKVPYSVHSHPEAYTAQEIAALSHVTGRRLVKVVMVKTGDGLAMLALPADHRVDFERVRRLVGPDAQLATENEFREAFPGCDVGAMPPFGNLFGIPVHVDRSLEEEGDVVFNAGTHTLTARMAFGDYVRLVNPRMADFATPPNEARLKRAS